jgi:hypothetical protein
MKKLLMFVLILSMFGQSAIAQKPVDSLKNKFKHDTVTVAVPVYEKFDTIKVSVVLYGTSNNVVLFTSPAFMVMKGFAMLGKNKQWQWTQQPAVFEYLYSDRKRKIDRVLQVIQ